MPTVIRVAIADDQMLVRAGFAALLAAEDDMEVAGEAADGAEAGARPLTVPSRHAHAYHPLRPRPIPSFATVCRALLVS